MHAVIVVLAAGKDLAERIAAKVVELEGKGFNAVYVDLDLSDPHTPAASIEMEGLGFIFSGVLPDYRSADVFRLQRYSTTVDYDEIETYSEFSEELKEYVTGLDPKWKATLDK